MAGLYRDELFPPQGLRGTAQSLARASKIQEGWSKDSPQIHLGSIQADSTTQLFSLTSVMETRESRMLNENVRLLTYATVFYLPLAFSSVGVTFLGTASDFRIYVLTQAMTNSLCGVSTPCSAPVRPALRVLLPS